MSPHTVVRLRAATMASPLLAVVALSSSADSTATAATPPPKLMVSVSADRASAQPLAGQALRGDAHIFVGGATHAARVGFYLDYATVRTSVDGVAPFDFVPPTASAASFGASRLAPGRHHLRARVMTAGRAADAVASFSVAPVGAVVTRSNRLYAPTSPWNLPLPAAPVLDSGSSVTVAHLAAKPAVADLYAYGFPVYDADASTPRYTVDCSKPWGPCGLEGQPVPIPSAAVPSPGTDGAMVIIDWGTRRAYDFWQARRTATGGWTASWGTVSSIDGDGRTDGATGPGLPQLGGLIRAAEIQAGAIDHAIAFSTDNACRRVFRYPAARTDGGSDQPDCVPEGARLQLDPAVDLTAIPGITPAEVTVGRALQRYGAYVRDNGGATIAFGFENPVLRPDPYPAAGLGWDYAAMVHIPWRDLRVLRQWDGS